MVAARHTSTVNNDKVALIVEAHSLRNGLAERLSEESFWVEEANLHGLNATLIAAQPDIVICRQKYLQRVQRALASVPHGEDVAVFTVCEKGREVPTLNRLPPGVCGASPYEATTVELMCDVAVHVASHVPDSLRRPTELNPIEERFEASGLKISLAPLDYSLEREHLDPILDGHPRLTPPTAAGRRADQISTVPPPSLRRANRANHQTFAKHPPPPSVEPRSLDQVPPAPAVPHALCETIRPPSPVRPAPCSLNPGTKETVRPAPETAPLAVEETARPPRPHWNLTTKETVRPAQLTHSTDPYRESWQPPSEALPKVGNVARISLVGSADRVQPVQILLREEDLEAGLELSEILQERGHRVLVVSEAAESSPWQRMRDFAPQVVLMDELACCEDGGQWLEALRSDPHLGHTPILTVRGDRIRQGEVSGLSAQLESVVRRERVFWNHLRPGRCIEYVLHQIGATRTLMALEASGRHAQLTVNTENQRLRWGFRDGHATAALLDWSGGAELLRPDQAMEWLVEHPLGTTTLHVVENLALQARASIEDVLATSHSQTPVPRERSSGIRVREHSTAEGVAQLLAAVPPCRQLAEPAPEQPRHIELLHSALDPVETSSDRPAGSFRVADFKIPDDAPSNGQTSPGWVRRWLGRLKRASASLG